MSKKILYQDNARKALEKGMQIMVEAVAVTLGPRGRNVVLEKQYGSPQIVNDGVIYDLVGACLGELELIPIIFN